MPPKKKVVEVPAPEPVVEAPVVVSAPFVPPADAAVGLYTDRSGAPRLNGLTEGASSLAAITAHAQSLTSGTE